MIVDYGVWTEYGGSCCDSDIEGLLRRVLRWFGED
jgi:hypothetical protein